MKRLEQKIDMRGMKDVKIEMASSFVYPKNVPDKADHL